MSMFDTIRAASPLRRAIAHRKYRQISLPQRQDFHSRLPARALLRHDELTAFEIAAGLGEQDRCLKRKHMLPVDVLMQAIEVTRNILQKQLPGERLAYGP